MARPNLKPTAEDRLKVKRFAACGTRHEDMARFLGFRSAKTLRKYFRDELDLGAAEANANVAAALYRNAVERGDTRAQEIWLKCRANWRDRNELLPSAQAPPPGLGVYLSVPLPARFPIPPGAVPIDQATNSSNTRPG